MKKQQIFLIIGAFIIIIVFAFLSVINCGSSNGCPWTRKEKVKVNLPVVKLTIAGPWDSKEDWAEIINKFNKYKKETSSLDVRIEYELVTDRINYKNAIKEMQFQGNGPNIFMIFNSWVPVYYDEIMPMPKEMMSLAQFKDTFAKVAIDDLTNPDGTIYSLPLYIDTLALYYNEDRFLNEHYIKPPETWDEFKNYVEKLTVLKKSEDESKTITIAGAAFGGGNNINRNQDIIILLAMQNNATSEIEPNSISFNNKKSVDAIKFYTDFTNPEKRFYTWNENQMYSIDAFVQRKAAMMINYSHHIDNIINKTGGTLNFKIAPIPQIDKDYEINYASYWVPIVPKIAPCETSIKIDCQKLAWEFINFATKKENIKSYLDSTNRASANLELASEQASDYSDLRSVFARQIFTAKSWYHPNDYETDQVLNEMINSIVTNDKTKKKSIEDAIQEAKNKINILN